MKIFLYQKTIEKLTFSKKKITSRSQVQPTPMGLYGIQTASVPSSQLCPANSAVVGIYKENQQLSYTFVCKAIHSGINLLQPQGSCTSELLPCLSQECPTNHLIRGFVLTTPVRGPCAQLSGMTVGDDCYWVGGQLQDGLSGEPTFSNWSFWRVCGENDVVSGIMGAVDPILTNLSSLAIKCCSLIYGTA